ncbi:unnamed protein product [Prorocentrum cordatum]|uniref:Uncharacterized protein n=1 Tax=Prorocentrum cordatum TaxID=2364126 RepID=A0ABN9XSA2_9DINO|nr:unnamed protein product [Polarella glacialis]
MTPRDFPEEAAPLRDGLVVRASQQIWKELVKEASRSDLSCKEEDGKFQTHGGVKDEDMIKWAKTGHNIIDSCGKVIEKEIYIIADMFWLSSSKRKTQWDVHKQERDAKEQRLQAIDERRKKRSAACSSLQTPAQAANWISRASPSLRLAGAAVQARRHRRSSPGRGRRRRRRGRSRRSRSRRPTTAAAGSGAGGRGQRASRRSRPRPRAPRPSGRRAPTATRRPTTGSYGAAGGPPPPPPPPRGHSLGQISEQSPVLSQARSMQSAHSMQSQQSAYSVHSAAYLTPQSQQSLASAGAEQLQRSRPGSLSSMAYVPSSPS